MQSQWNFQFNPKASLTANLKPFFKNLEFQHLQFITNSNFKNKDKPNFLYNIIDISFHGSPIDLRNNISTSMGQLLSAIENLMDSDEPNQNKIHQFHSCIFLIKELLVKNNIYNFELIDFNQLHVLHHYKSLKFLNVSIKDCNTKKVDSDIKKIQQLINVNLDLLKANLDASIEYLKVDQLEHNLSKSKISNKTNELKLLEVWLGLKNAGLIKNSDNKIFLSQHRKKFFQLFELSDENYNTRHRDLRQRKPPIGRFLSSLVDLIEKEFKPRIKKNKQKLLIK